MRNPLLRMSFKLQRTPEANMDISTATELDRTTPHGFERWKQVALRTFRLFIDPDTSPRCAATAFFGFLSIFPAIATVALIYGLLANRALVADTVSSLEYILPSLALDVLREQLTSLAAQPPTTLGIGLLISVPLALWSSSRGVDALLFAMSRVRGEPEKRGFIEAALVAIGLSIGASIFMVVALLTIAGLPALIPFPSGEDLLVLLLRWPILLVLSVAVLAALYRWGPDRHPRKFRFIWPGALLASLLWLLAGAIFSIYVENFGNYQATFGSVSAAVVLLLWLYNSAQILVLGAAFNTELEFVATGQPRELAPSPKA
jgi:membrane protein